MVILSAPKGYPPKNALEEKPLPPSAGEEFAWVHSEQLGASIIRVAPHKYVTMNARHDDMMPPAMPEDSFS